MKQPIKINEVIVVEGKYDKIKLSSIIDTMIVTTNGFGLFKDKEKMAYLRSLAEKRGIVILTDSDSAGFVIRNHIVSCIDKKYIKNAYIPDILGKEKRKTSYSKEGKLGVEGVDVQIILNGLKQAGVSIVGQEQQIKNDCKVTKTQFYKDGFTGRENSEKARAKLIKKLNLPEKITTNALIDSINIMIDFKEYENIVKQIKDEE